jgi:hypothetical protein
LLQFPQDALGRMMLVLEIVTLFISNCSRRWRADC